MYKQLKRITVEITDSKDLYQFSKPNTALKSYDLVAVKPRNEKMFELSCGDLNVDIITIPLEEKINFNLKKNLIRAGINRGIFFEINYCEFIKDYTKRNVYISNVLSILEVTKGKNLIISSGSDNFLYHRSPYDILVMFQSIFELKKEFVQDLISKNCENAFLKSIQRKYYKTVVSLVPDLELISENQQTKDVKAKNDMESDK